MSAAELEQREHSIYVMWSGESAIYVGMTSAWDGRMAAHGVWWLDEPTRFWNPDAGYSAEITHVDVWHVGMNRADVRQLERQTIDALVPSHNRTGASRKAARRPWAERVAESARHREDHYRRRVARIRAARTT